MVSRPKPKIKSIKNNLHLKSYFIIRLLYHGIVIQQDFEVFSEAGATASRCRVG